MLPWLRELGSQGKIITRQRCGARRRCKGQGENPDTNLSEPIFEDFQRNKRQRRTSAGDFLLRRVNETFHDRPIYIIAGDAPKALLRRFSGSVQIPRNKMTLIS